MSIVRAGFLLPVSVLSSSWFLVLATAVAFNTIIYLGLTLSKLMHWPRQIHPSRIRSLLRRDIDDVNTEENMQFQQNIARPESGDPYEAMRLRVARASIQQGFALVGGLIIVLSVLGLVFIPDASIAQHTLIFAFGVGYLGLGLIATHRILATRQLIWIWTIAAIALAGLMLWLTTTGENPAALAYLLIILVGLPQAALSWKPAIFGEMVVLVGLVIGTESLTTEYDVHWLVAGVAAMLTGGALMKTRLDTLDAITEQTLRADFVATTDPLTGMLTRQGLATLLPGLASLARRDHQQVVLVFVGIDQLKKFNEQYGLNYGDEVLKCVAQAVRETVRLSDYVARWDGGLFLMVGMATDAPDADLLKIRIDNHIVDSGVNLGKWPTTVSVRTGQGDPGVATFDGLVAQILNH